MFTLKNKSIYYEDEFIARLDNEAQLRAFDKAVKDYESQAERLEDLERAVQILAARLKAIREVAEQFDGRPRVLDEILHLANVK
jgi:hypothetical protein